MSRSTYFYCLAPLFTGLSCLPNTMGLLPSSLLMVLACVLILIAWGLIWMRLFNSKHLRPEFSLLPVLPYAIFLYLISFGQSLLELIQTPMWGNFYFLLWIAAGFVSAKSLKLTPAEQKESEGKDTSGVMMRVSCFLFAALGWFACASILFPLQ